jgi:rhodanese-related sulfurtransferase
MDCQTPKEQLSVRVVLRSVVTAAALSLVCVGLFSCRGVDWFLLKRSLHGKFSGIDWITTRQLADWLAEKNRPQPVLLDVRTLSEWKVSHLPGARQVDPKADAESAAGGLAKAAPIVTYCSVGYRSGAMAKRLQTAGYTHVKNLEDSIFQWAHEGRMLVHDGERTYRVHPYNAFWGRLLEPELRAAALP